MYTVDTHSPFSLVTIVRGRKNHLNNLLRGVLLSTVIPDEIIVVDMDEAPYEIRISGLNIRYVRFPQSSSKPVPVAQARNLGAQRAKHEIICFLDVDCIPSKKFFETLLNQSNINHGLIMGQPAYLLRRVDLNCSESFLFMNSLLHPERPVITTVEKTTTYGLFWSLAFLISKSLFETLEGFDENYEGYGAEDTDFAFRNKEFGIPLYLSEAIVFHQQHPVYSPSLNAFNEIISNCKIFYDKWKLWPMDNWLSEFAQLNLIAWNTKASAIEILNTPTKDMIATAYKPDAPFM